VVGSLPITHACIPILGRVPDSPHRVPDRKNSQGEWVGESTRRSRVRLRDCVVGSGGGFEGDPVAEGRELGDVVADASLGDDAVGVVIGAEVVEAGGVRRR
jgi:hypothetical protein